MIYPVPVTLEGNGVRLEPMTAAHADALQAAAADGALWRLWVTSVPEPEQTASYIASALEGQRAGHMLPWVVRELGSHDIIGTTRYHDIVAESDRVEIGYTWYAKRWQRSHVNTSCKLLLMAHAFDALKCGVVGLRTDNFNFASQKAIEALGARKDGVIRHHFRRRDGSMRDSVMYSILAHEWPDVRKNLEGRLERHETTGIARPPARSIHAGNQAPRVRRVLAIRISEHRKQHRLLGARTNIAAHAHHCGGRDERRCRSPHGGADREQREAQIDGMTQIVERAAQSRARGRHRASPEISTNENTAAPTSRAPRPR